MNRIAVAMLVAFSASIAVADDFKTTDGNQYKNVTVSRVEPDGIVIKSKSGISKLYFNELPKEVQERFHYDPAKAAQFNAAELAQPTAAEQAESARSNAAFDQQQAKPRPRENVRTIREVETDQRKFLDRAFLLKGTIEVSNYYEFGYRDAHQTHYSFKITDDSQDYCCAYIERMKAAELRERLLNAGGPVKGVFTVVLLSSRYEPPILRIPEVALDVELLSYRLEQ